jgi:protein-L-isoaspartate(D-aspartate) O-methyltransferase
VAESYFHALKVGGRLLAVVGTKPAMAVQMITRTSEWDWQTETLFETVIPTLINAEAKPEFEF